MSDDFSRRVFVRRVAMVGGGTVLLGAACKRDPKPDAGAPALSEEPVTSHRSCTNAERLTVCAAGGPPGADVPSGALPSACLQATTASFAAIVFCQVGTAFAARTERVSLRSVGLTTNRLLLGGIAFELVFAAALIYLPPLQVLFGTAALPAWVIAMLLPMPVVVWGADELFRWATRRRA